MSDQSTDAKVGDIAGENRSFADMVKSEAMEWFRLLVVFIPALFVLTMFGFEQRVIPSESMVPSLQVGDRVLVNKFAYGYSRYSVPWGVDRILPLGEGRIFEKLPERGDVVVFMHPHFRRVMIKRVIGLPGDRIEVRNEQLYLNDEPVPSEEVRELNYIPHGKNRIYPTREYRETLGDTQYLTHQWRRNAAGDTTAVFQVPDGHLFFMGDNRDNSKDARDLSGHCAPVNGVISRAGCQPRVSLSDASVGFVPVDALIGRGVTVAWTTKRCRQGRGIDCPPKRVWRGL